MTEKEIRKLVYAKYPRTQMERQGCKKEMARLTALRDMYRDRIEQDRIHKRESPAKLTV